jgi:hypothetical protein
VQITVTSAPTAENDALTSKVNRNITFPANTLFNNNGNGIDDLGTPADGDPAASITTFGNFNGISGDATEFAFDTTQTIPAPINGDLTVNSDGSLGIDNPTAAGTFTFQYTLDNGIGAGSVATVTVNVVPAPVAQNDSYTFLGTVDQTFNAANGLFVDNGSGSDSLGAPASALTSFGGGDLPGTITSNVAGASVASAAMGGTLTVNGNGSFSLIGQPFNEGTYAFDYRLTNSAGTSDATVTIVISSLPIAQDDDFTIASTSNQTAPSSLLLDNGNGADTVAGATITHFGGGSLGGAVTDNAGGASQALANGTLTINTDGTWTLTGQPFTGGVFTVNYRLTNAGGTSDATVTLNITTPPIATTDNPSMISVPGNYFHGVVNTANMVANDDADDLDQNDTLGNPVAAIDGFGAIQFNDGAGVLGAPIGSATANAAGVTLNFSGLGVAGISNGSLVVNANGSYTLTPPTNYTGALGFQYRLTNTSGSSTATVTLATGIRPLCTADAYTSSVNLPIAVPDGINDVNSNDSGDQISIAQVQGSAANIGNFVNGTGAGSSSSQIRVQVNANGSFNYSPAAGLSGSSSFNYHIANGFGISGPCTVTVTPSQVSGASAWFIDQSAGGSSNIGTFDNPFTSIASFNTQNVGGANQPASNNVIYLDPNGAYNESDGINLLDSQKLIGGSVAFNTVYPTSAPFISNVYSAFAAAAEGPRSAIAATAGDGIDLAQYNTVNGIDIGNTPTGFGLDGAVVGTPIISNVDITGTGGALRISTSGNLGSVALGTVSSSSSNAENITLTGTSGALSFASGGTGLSGSAATASAIRVNGGSVGFTYPGAISKSNVGRLVLVESNTGGTKTLSGTLSSTSSATGVLVQNNTGGITNFSGSTKTINTGTNSAVTLTNNSGSTSNFTNGGLDIDTTSGAGFSATGGGTINVASTGTQTINTTSGTALSLNGVGGTTDFDTITSTALAGSDGIDITGLQSGTVTVTTASLTGGGVDINGAHAGSLSIDNLDVALNGTNQTAFDLSSATLTGNVLVNDYDVTSSSTTGTVSINLAGATGTGTVRFGDTVVGGGSTSVTGVQDGVVFSAATNLGSFTYGDGEEAVDALSSISAVTVFAGTVPTNGSYNFLDAGTLTGDIAAVSGVNAYYVDQAQSGTNDGSSAAMAGSIANAEASSANVIVLVDTNLNMSADTISIGTNSLNLDDGQILISYNSSSTAIDVATLGYTGPVGPPAGFMLNSGIGGGSSIISVPGGIDLTSPSLSSTTADAFVLAGSAGIAGVTIVSSGADGISYAGSGTETVIFQDLNVTGGTSALNFGAGISGTLTDTGSTYTGGTEDTTFINNTSGTFTANFTNINVGLNDAATGENGIHFVTSGSATGTLNVNGSTFTGSQRDMIYIEEGGTANATINIGGTAGNNFTRNQLTISGESVIHVESSGSGIVNTTISNNLILAGTNTFEGDGISLLHTSTPNGTLWTGAAVLFSGTHRVTITSNTIGTDGVNGSAFNPSSSLGDSGIALIVHGVGTVIALIDNNDIFDYNASGIELETINAPTTGTYDVTIINNTVSDVIGASTLANASIFIFGDGDPTTCVDIQDNRLNNPNGAANAHEIAIDVTPGAGTYRTPGLTVFTEAELAILVAANNTDLLGNPLITADIDIFTEPSIYAGGAPCVMP